MLKYIARNVANRVLFLLNDLSRSTDLQQQFSLTFFRMLNRDFCLLYLQHKLFNDFFGFNLILINLLRHFSNEIGYECNNITGQLICYLIIRLRSEYMAQNTEQIYERDDIHDLNDKITKNPFNMLAHKRIKKLRPSLTEDSELSNEKNIVQANRELINFVKTIDLRNKANQLTDISEIEKKQEVSHISTYSKDKKKWAPIIMNQTVNVKSSPFKQSSVSSNYLRKKSSNSIEIDKLADAKRQWSQPKTIEKQMGKGPLNEKHLMNWLNQILIEYCFDAEHEKGQLKALQRFGLDNNTLLSRGMNPENIFRLYRSLFVYSIGFNNIIKKLSNQSPGVLKSIWKVYVILLEYCSQGNFQTTMGQLERDTIQVQQKLKGEIQKREIIINNNEEIIEQRLHKYIKENKQFKLKAKNLEEKIHIVEKQFREIEIAYNIEVSLRLAYEYKINQIYSVHEKLNILHLNLYKEFQEKHQENSKLSKQSWAAKQNIIELKSYNEELANNINEMKRIIKINENLIEGFQLNQKQLSSKLNTQTKTKREETLEMREKDKKIGELIRDQNNNKLIIEMMKSSTNSHMDEYRRLTMENSELRRNNYSQVEKINQLLSDIKYLNSKESRLKCQLQYAQNRIKELEKRVADVQCTVDQLSKVLEKKEIELRTKCLEQQSHRKLTQAMDLNMKEIKSLYSRIEQENKTLIKYSQEISFKYSQVHHQFMDLQLKYKENKEQKFQIELELNKKISQIMDLQKKYQSENYQDAKKYEKLSKGYKKQDDVLMEKHQQLENAKTLLETANLRISFLSERFTDLNFEKSKIEGIYKDNLVLHQKEKQAQKILMIQLSSTSEKLQESRRILETNQRHHKNLQNKLNKQKEKLTNRVSTLEAALKKKEGFVHPMLLQDSLETIKRQMENHYTTRITLENEVQMKQETIKSLQIGLQRKQFQFRQNVKELEQRVSKMMSEMESERQYFQNRSSHLSSLINDLETKLTYKTMEAEMKKEESPDNKLMDLMKQKNGQITELLKELQRIQDNFQKKCTDYEHEIKQIHQSKEGMIVNLKQSKRLLEVKVVEIEKHFSQKLVEKQKEKEQIMAKMMQENEAKEEKLDAQPIIDERKQTFENKRQRFISKFKLANAYYNK